MDLRLALMATLLTLASSALSQSLVYVDASLGDDGNPGTQDAPFRTLTRATDFIDGASSGSFDRYRILMGPGVHDAPLGESFPIVFRSNVTLSPTDAAGDRIIDGDGAPLAVLVDGEDPVAPDKGLRGLTVRDAGTGIAIGDGGQDFFVRYLYDCVVTDCNVGLEAINTAATFPVDLQWSGGAVRQCFFGVRAGGDRWVNLDRLDFTDFGANGVSSSGTRRLTVNQGTFQGGDFAILAAGGPVPTEVSVTSTVISGFVSGIQIPSQSSDQLDLSVDHCTIARCSAAFGVEGAFSSTSLVQRSVLVGNFGAFLNGAQNGLSVRDSLVESSGVVGQGLVIESATAAFLDLSNDDFRLRRTSLAVDALPATPQDPNPVDGNRDTVNGRDMGALQLETLDGPFEASIGTTVNFVAAADPVGTGFGVLQPRFSSGAVFSTAYGLLRVEPALASRVARLVPDAATGSAPWAFDIPNDASIIGESWVFQALTPSATAPQGFAFTGAVEVRLRP